MKVSALGSDAGVTAASDAAPVELSPLVELCDTPFAMTYPP